MVRPTAEKMSETKPWGLSQRRVCMGLRREEVRIERPMRTLSEEVAYMPPALRNG